ncbi:MAG: methyl-accepting chemotaxis protein [Phycisphaerales bacterium]
MRQRTAIMLVVLVSCAACGGGALWSCYGASRRLLIESLRAEVQALARSAATAVDVSVHDRVRDAKRMDTEEYHAVERRLRQLRDAWRDAGMAVRFVYTLVPDPKAPWGLAFAVDAEEEGKDKSKPGDPLQFTDLREEFHDYERQPAIIAADAWGVWMTAFAPVRRADGSTAAVVGVDLSMESVRTLERTLFWTGAGTTGLLFGGCMFLAALVTGRVTGPFERLARWMRRLADGDLGAPAETIGRGDAAQLASAADRLAGSLRSMVMRAKSVRQSMDAACRDLAERAAEERDRARAAAMAANDSATRAGEIAHTSTTLADAGRELRRSFSAVSAAARGGVETLQGITGGVETLRTSADGVRAQFEALRERARAMDDLLEAMVAVADQSSLLALNAEIEATKAGDAGRGFMVVAGEIRRLTDTAAANALQIEAQLRQMREALDGGTTAMTELAERLREGAALAQQGTGQLEASLRGVGSVGPRVAEVADASERQREGAAAISAATGTIAASATNALGFFEAVEGLVRDLAAQIQALEEETARYRTDLSDG